MKKNYHQFEIKGLNQERFFNSLSQKFHIFEIERLQKNHSIFKVELRYGKKVKKEILSAGFEIVSEKSSGIFFLLSKWILSYGFIAGIVISAVLYAIQYQFVQRIEVWGIDDVAEVKQFVQQSLTSKYKNNIDTDLIEQQIKRKFEDLGFVSAAIVGQTLIVNVKNSIIPPEMQGQFAPIVSQYDGVITSIKLIQGTLNVAVGDIIQCGQTLVEGKVTNSLGEVLFLPPKAEIEMNVWCEGESTHYDSQMITFRTGKNITQTRVTLWGNEFYSHCSEVGFEQYEVETFSQVLTKNNLLPFVVTKSIYYETKTELIESSFDERKDECFASAKANCLQKMPECAIIKSEDYKIIEGAGRTTVRCVITASLIVTGEK